MSTPIQIRASKEMMTNLNIVMKEAGVDTRTRAVAVALAFIAKVLAAKNKNKELFYKKEDETEEKIQLIIL